ncbi:hypothetical protein IDJ75_07900 [Mucilaginibacter rigui]|uniref:Uncharacterized protein n=1 Tax=Mucilaginibacter rigui TaxID=534635 RepID=A0ABR7X3N7_9SPHI|nr:hypothetical protein [Mucilaginibacter rigui]MBD1385199.1 hypothetical protein [Mucilaginibacter rigui]
MENEIGPFEENVYKWFFNNKITITVSGYILAIILIVWAHKVDPISLAGPGLDCLVYPIVLIFSVVSCIKSLNKITDSNKTYFPLVITNIVGLISIIMLLFIA